MSRFHHPPAPGPARFGLSVALPYGFVVLVWSSTWYVVKDQVGLAPPGWTIAARFAIAALGMAVLALVRGESLRLGPRAAGLTALVGTTLFCLNFQCVYRAEQSLTSGIMAIILSLLIIPNAVFARLLFKVPLERGFVIGSAVALAGIGLLLLTEYRAAPPTAAVGTGLLFGFAALAFASMANVAQVSPTARATPTLPLTAWAMGIGATLDLGLAWAIHGPPPPDLSPRFWLGAAYLGLIGSVLTFPLYFDLFRKIGAGKASYINVATPILAMAISTVLEGFRWTGLAVGGAALAVAGMVIALVSRRG